MQLNYKRKLRVDQAVVVKTGSTYYKSVRLVRTHRLAWSYMENADPSLCPGMTRKRTVIGEVTLNFE